MSHVCVYVCTHAAGAPCPAATYTRIHLDAVVTEVSHVCVYRSQRDKVQARKLSEDFSKTLAKFQEAVKVTLAKEREFVHPTAKRGGGGGGGVGGGGRLDEADGEREGLLRAEEREREREQQDRLRMAQMMQADRDLDYSEALVMCA